jgi:SAM-dependent methyltransferase
MLTRKQFISRLFAIAAALSVPDSWATALAKIGSVRTRGTAPSNFHAIYADPKLRDRFFLFMQNVFHLYPEVEFHLLIEDLVAKHADAKTIYQELQKGLGDLGSVLSPFTYALPALKKQKQEMTEQSLALMGERKAVNGFLEIGSTGRYISDLRNHIALAGPIYIVNDIAPSYGPTDIMERGALGKIGSFIPMGNYDPFVGEKIPPKSLDLVTNFIGFHHCPLNRLEGFVRSIHEVLRPGGRFLLRDHDVDSTVMVSLVALAHDVFNAGVNLTWQENHEQVRLFRSMRDWSAYLSAAGFKRTDKALAQANDPTQNLMVEFVKV